MTAISLKNDFRVTKIRAALLRGLNQDSTPQYTVEGVASDVRLQKGDRVYGHRLKVSEHAEGMHPRSVIIDIKPLSDGKVMMQIKPSETANATTTFSGPKDRFLQTIEEAASAIKYDLDEIAFRPKFDPKTSLGYALHA